MGHTIINAFNSSSGEEAQVSQLAMRRDQALAKLASEGDREAFKAIVDTNKQRMFTVARSVLHDAELAEDAVQESFIKAYRALEDFRGQSRLSTWLHRITYLTAIDLQRQRQRHLRLVDDDYAEDAAPDLSSSGSGENAAESRRIRTHIQAAMETLSDFEQTVFTLRHLQNFKIREIAVVVDRSEGTIKNILFRAIRKLRDQLAADFPAFTEFE